VRRGLARWVEGRTIASVEVLHARAVRRHIAGAADLAARLRGQTFGTAARRGKYLWLPLREDAGQRGLEGEAVVLHLGMSGQLLVQPATRDDEKHVRVRITFADGGRELRFVDQRTFGGMALETLDADGVPESVAHIAFDPFDDRFDVSDFARRLRARRTGLKRALLDQTLVSGIGNIYADEALWGARLHYARATEGITAAEADRVIEHARAVMAAALAQGGTSFDSLYVNVNGESGWFERSLEVYGRAGEPCRRCGSLVRRESFMNRSSYFCPICQRHPRHPRW